MGFFVVSFCLGVFFCQILIRKTTAYFGFANASV